MHRTKSTLNLYEFLLRMRSLTTLFVYIFYNKCFQVSRKCLFMMDFFSLERKLKEKLLLLNISLFN